MSTTLKKYVFLLLFLAVNLWMYAQTTPPPPNPPPPGLPIDGGVLILALLGAIYGIRKQTN